MWPVVAPYRESDRQKTVHTGPYGALPILIFSHDPATALSRKFPPAWVASPALRVDLQNLWSQEQEDLKKLSTRGRRIVAKGSNHGIQGDRPDANGKRNSGRIPATFSG